MKHTVHVTATYSVEVDDSEIKAEFRKINKKLIIAQAMNSIDPNNAFDTSAKIFESYPEVKQKIRRGIGSY